jgi:predicted helicase
MSLALKPTHATVKAYYETLHQYGQLHIDHEGAVRSAFQELLAKSGRKAKPQLTLVPEYRIERARGSSVIVDGALVDLYHLPHGYWEAKDEKDDLAKEVQLKLDKGYPRDNIIFQAPERAILYQGGARILDENITSPESLVQVVNQFFDYKAPHIQEWEQAVADFSERIPELAAAVKKTIDEERRRNPAFVRSFDDFYALRRQAINPNLSEEAVERMLVQHLLTERIFRKIFDNPDFTRRNVVAAEIEKVINELTKRAFNRDEFLGNLDRFYKAIEQSAENATRFSEKQAFLNKVYERFFQGYSPKEADTHGIVYTPQPIVNFMVRSVEEILQKEFGRSLGDKGVHILDPFVGTGNFIVRIMQEIKATDLQYKYEHELHCNEVMLLPYYIASMNIEHKYFDRTGEYKAFPGICLVDTFELAEAGQGSFGFMTAENAERVKHQKESPIFVIIGNPPYNAWQVNENDNNKNRTYPVVDGRVAETYAASSSATNKNALSDMYVKAFRWASDRIGDEGVVALITNNGFLDGLAFDGMRRDLAATFSTIYHLDLKGNARTSGVRRQKEGGNVFENAIRVGVGITLLVKRQAESASDRPVHLSSVDDFLTLGAKQQFLADHDDLEKITWRDLQPDASAIWLTEGIQKDYGELLALGAEGPTQRSLFNTFSNGLKTNRDVWTYNFDRARLIANARNTIEFYNLEVDRWKRSGKKVDSVDDFVRYDESRVSWSRDLKQDLSRGRFAEFADSKVRRTLYRPYVTTNVFFDRIFDEEVYSLDVLFPASSAENQVICITAPGSEKPFLALSTLTLADFHLVGAGSGTQCFPFYTYTEDGSNRRENITDWALEQFRSRYHDPSISKWDIFHYIYAVLHHPEYRERYAANLRRELPRIPFVSAILSDNCHSEPASGGEESAPSADKKQVPRFAPE